jgi:hypothetical protein
MPTFLFGPPKKSNPDVGLAAGQSSPGRGRRRVRQAARRVLIVEDEAMIAGLIESILSASTAGDWMPRYSTSASTAMTPMPWRTF